MSKLLKINKRVHRTMYPQTVGGFLLSQILTVVRTL